MNLNKESYNKVADQWAESRSKSFLSRLVIDFASKINPGGKILDIGCGFGCISKYLSEQGFKVTGIDISENLLKKAIDQKIPNAAFYLYDFFEFEPREKYDGVVAFDSFFHFPKDKQSGIYQRVSKWMNKGAYLFFTHGSREGEIYGEMFGAEFYYSCLDTKKVHELLAKAGFDIEASIEGYKERDMDRDLVVLAKKK